MLRAQKKDKFYSEILTKLKEAEFNPNVKLPKRIAKHYTLYQHTLVARKDRSNIPKICLDLKCGLLTLAAVHLLNHSSIQTTIKLVKSRFYIKGIHHLCRTLISSCRACRLGKRKGVRDFIPGKAMGKYLTSHSFFGSMFILDHVINSPCYYNRKKYVGTLVIYDLFSGYTIVKPVGDLTGKTVVECLKAVIQCFSAPVAIASEAAKCFTGNEVQDFLREKIIKYVSNLANNPESHSLIERRNLDYRNLLNIFKAAYKVKEWVQVIPRVQKALNSIPRTYWLEDRKGKVTKKIMTPHELVFGSRPTDLDKFLSDIPGNADSIKLREEIKKQIRAFHASRNEEQQRKDEAVQSKLEP